ncbi:hypothetical protein [Chromobacterium haemolyticum]|uniref:hypothetical protein n=1 Tax=Chromobacterium haemolyticum TaxID=394935 RepID=UPI00244CE3C4|nr:hypothetical protein [Chromobacterium haemolyticum]MDH0342165.1 hypothetical protein [Chromobacterium haemolyticum]
MKKKLAAVAVATSLIVVPVYKAQAYICCDPWGWVGYAAFVQAGTMVVSSITSAATSIVEVIEGRLSITLNNGFGKYGAELSKQSAHQKVFKQGAVAVGGQLYMQERSAEAAVNAVTPAQQALTVTNAMMLSEQSTVVRQKVSVADRDFMANFYATNPVDSSVIIARHKPYCSAVDVDMGRCEPLASPTMQNADLNVNTILNPGEGQYETLADEERDAAKAFVLNVVNPLPEVRLSASQNQSPQAKTVDALLLADQAALSVAAHSFNSQIALRTRRHQQ